jgi:hypothetical protein
MKVPQLEVTSSIWTGGLPRNDTAHQKNCSRLGWCLREPTMER